jgi:hypothetical protein
MMNYRTLGEALKRRYLARKRKKGSKGTRLLKTQPIKLPKVGKPKRRIGGGTR